MRLTSENRESAITPGPVGGELGGRFYRFCHQVFVRIMNPAAFLLRTLKVGLGLGLFEQSTHIRGWYTLELAHFHQTGLTMLINCLVG